MDDLISRKVAIDWIKGWFDTDKHYHPYSKGKTIQTCEIMDILERVPSAQPEPAIPLQWIEAQIEWLKSLDNAFTTLTASQISAMVKKWKDEQDE